MEYWKLPAAPIYDKDGGVVPNYPKTLYRYDPPRTLLLIWRKGELSGEYVTLSLWSDGELVRVTDKKPLPSRLMMIRRNAYSLRRLNIALKRKGFRRVYGPVKGLFWFSRRRRRA